MHKRLIACLAFILAAGFASPAEDARPVMTILHTNDIHGRFAVSDAAIGHDRVAAIYRAVRARVPATILVDAGDAVQGNSLVKWNKGEAAIEIMAAAGYDAMVLGNHEFDYGWDRLAELADTSPFPLFTQPVVSGGEGGFQTAAIYERGGRRFGVFGLTTPETRQASDGGMDRTFGDTDELVLYADLMADALRRHGAEIVVCLAHFGIEDQGFITSYVLRDRTTGIDVIVDGHSHSKLAEIEQAAGKALIVSTGEHGQALGVVDFHCLDGRLRPTARSIFKDETLDVDPVPEVTKTIDRWVAETETRMSRVLVRIDHSFENTRDMVRTRETALGNLLTDAMREAAGSDAALLNGGNIRAPLPAGDVTVGDLEAVLPFDSTVVAARIRGGVLREALELSVSRYPMEYPGFLQASGISFAFDPAKPAGSRLSGVEIGGKALDADAVYGVSVCDWLAIGGDGYEMFVKPFAGALEKETPDLIDVFVRYLRDHPDREARVEGRIAVE